MLHKFLIFLFLFNAIIPSAFAMQGVSDCDMVMEESNQSLMPLSTVAMDCEMTEKSSCGIFQCVTNCTPPITPLIIHSQEQLSISFDNRTCPQSDLAYFYSITYPVSTPPPLV